MKRLLATTFLFALLAVAVAACAAPSGSTGGDSSEQETTASRVAQAHTLARQRQYGRALDTFVQLAGDETVRDEAVSGAAQTLLLQAETQRVPQRVHSALELGKRLPTAGDSRRQLNAALEKMLVDPVIAQVRQAEALLRNRRAFVEGMREHDEADVMPTPTGEQRYLTEGEVVWVKNRLPDLGLNAQIFKLYRFERPLAAAMDRFIGDDQRYLAEEEVTDDQLDEIEQSCDVLADALWPVQRQLDRVRPDWRPKGEQ